MAFRAVLDILQSFSRNEEQQQLVPVANATAKSESQSESESESSKFLSYRELLKLGIKPIALRLRDRHRFFHRLPAEDRAEARQILSNQNVTNKEKIDLTCNALKLKYNIHNAPNDRTDTNHSDDRKIFVLDGTHSCVVIGETESDLHENVIDHFKIMLNLNESIIN